MHYRTLEKLPVTELHRVFLDAFSDYLVPIRFTLAQLKLKLLRDGYRPSYSAGMFEQENPVGYILNGIDSRSEKLCAYNSGTGIVPACRGNRGTRRMYEFLLPLLQQQGVEICLLDVIIGNDPAIRSYSAIGFEVVREFICYAGCVEAPPRELPDLSWDWQAKPDWERWQGFWTWRPSWQNDLPAVRRIESSHEFVTLCLGETLVAYAAFVPAEGYLSQFAVHPQYRNQGIGKTLFGKLCQRCGNALKLTNVDQSDEATNSFLYALGMRETVRQYEMEWHV